MIFKSHRDQLLAIEGGFEPGFGSSIADAVVASCSAHPFFEEVALDLGRFGRRQLADGGHMANNPTLLALIDTVRAIGIPREHVRLLSVGTGRFPKKRGRLYGTAYRGSAALRLFETLLESSTRTMEWLSDVFFRDIRIVRINEAHVGDDYRTSSLETDVDRLRKLYSVGVEEARKVMSDLELLFECAPRIGRVKKSDRKPLRPA